MKPCCKECSLQLSPMQELVQPEFYCNGVIAFRIRLKNLRWWQAMSMGGFAWKPFVLQVILMFPKRWKLFSSQWINPVIFTLIMSGLKPSRCLILFGRMPLQRVRMWKSRVKRAHAFCFVVFLSKNSLPWKRRSPFVWNWYQGPMFAMKSGAKLCAPLLRLKPRLRFEFFSMLLLLSMQKLTKLILPYCLIWSGF